ncbi:hypothetical protein [Mesorhizobium sp.]|nr:hypothetical protein [Mesorhizobium sp.]RWG37212.1 MAG: hypothetical protein EOQ60_01685 [Mesorhizobium sp.]
MNACDRRTDAARQPSARPGQENAAGTQACDFRDYQYGRRRSILDGSVTSDITVKMQKSAAPAASDFFALLFSLLG